MPSYDYRCQQCDTIFEAFQGIHEQPLDACPACSGPVQRLIGSGAGLIFKGSGFYITDYKNQSSTQKQSEKKANEAA